MLLVNIFYLKIKFGMVIAVIKDMFNNLKF